MTLKGIFAVISAGLAAVVSVLIALLSGKNKELATAKKENSELENTVKTQSTVITESAEARKETNENMEKIDSGNNFADFDSTLELLHNSANKRKN